MPLVMPQCHFLPVPGQQIVGSMSVTGNPCHPTQACPPSLPQRSLHLWVHCASTGVTEESLANIQKKNDLVHLVLGIILSVGCFLVGINVYICYAFPPLNPAMYHFLTSSPASQFCSFWAPHHQPSHVSLL